MFDEKDTQNLDATPLEPLFQSAGMELGSSPVEPFAETQETAAPAPDGEVLDPLAEEQAPARKGGLQSRIDKLVRRNYETKNENEVLKTQIATLSQQLLTLSGQVAQRNAPRLNTVPGVTPDPDNLFGGDAPSDASPAPADDIVGTVEAVIQKHLAPLVQRERVAAEQAALNDLHVHSFAEAAREYPDLMKADSELRQTFNALFDGAEPGLKRLPNAPVLIATMARGLVADQRRSEQKLTDRKRAAATHVPIPTPTDADVASGRVPKSVEEAVKAARERLRSGDSDIEDFKLLRQYGRLKQFGTVKQRE